MSSHVDERIVEMRFENAQFEKGVSQTMQSLDKLNNSLKLEESGKGLNDLQHAVNTFTLSSISENVESLKESFSVLGLVGQAAIAKITNAAIDMGMNLVKSVSTAQISAGWGKYESKLSAVQTIMAATRKEFAGVDNQMELVNAQLEKLNWFTDETSYNFLDMVNNIGKFTSNNVSLEKSVTAMQGISTWAAISGGTINEAGRAMYNLSQSLAQGSVRLMDWKSIENANMATAEFKETAIETAIALKTLTRGADGVVRSAKGNEVTIEKFSSTLSDLWFTSDVLLATLSKYGHVADLLNSYGSELKMTATDMLINVDKFKDGTIDLEKLATRTGSTAERLNEIFSDLTSNENELGLRAFKAAQEAKTFSEALASVKDAVSTGWMNTFELLFGNYEKAKVMWTDLANGLYEIFAEGGNERNDFLAEWANQDNHGQEMFIEGMYNLFGSLKDIILEVREAFKNIFPEVTVANAVELTRKFRDFTARVREAFTVLHEKVSPVEDALKAAKEQSDELAESAKKLAEPLYDVAEVAQKVISGLYGNGQYRVDALRQAGYSYELVQNKVNELLGCTFRYTEILDANGNALEDIADIAKDTSEEERKLSDEIEEVSHTEERHYSVMDNLISTFRGFFAIVRIVKNAISAIGRVISPAIKFFIRLGDAVLGVTGTIGDYLDNLSVAIETNDTFYLALKKVWDFLESFLGPVFEKIMHVLEKLADRQYLDKLNEKLTEFEEKTGLFETLSETFTSVFEAIKTGADLAAGAIGTMLSKISGSGFLTTIGSGITTIVQGIGKLKTNIVGPAFNQIKTRLKEMAESAGFVTTSFGEFMASAKTLGVFPRLFKTTVANPVDKELAGRTGLLGSFYNFLYSWKTYIGEFFSTLLNSDKAADETSERLTSTKAALTTFASTCSTSFKTATTFAENLKNTIAGFLTTIGNMLVKLDPKSAVDWLFDKAKQGMLIAFLFTITSAISKFKGVFGGLADFLDEARKSLSAWNTQIKTKSLINVAIAVAILAGSLFMLAQLDTDKLITAGVAIVALAGMLALISKILGDVVIKGGPTAGVQYAEMALSMLAIAGSVFIMAMALNSIADLDYGKAIKGGLYIIGIIGILVGVMAVISKIPFAGDGKGTLMAAASVFLLVMSLQKIVDMLVQLSNYNFGTIMKAMVNLLAIIGIIALIVKAAVGVKAGAGFGMILIALSLFLFVKALEKLTTINFKELGVTFTDLIGIVVTVILVIGILSKLGESTGTGLGVVIIGLAVLLWAMADSMTKLADIEPGKLAKAGFAVTLLLGVIGGIVTAMLWYGKGALMGNINSAAIVTSMLALIGGVIALAMVITYVAEIPDDKLIKGEGAVLGLLTFLAIAMGQASKLNKANIAPIIAMIGMVAVIAGAIYLLANYVDPNAAIIAAASLAIAFGALTAVIFSMSASAPALMVALANIEKVMLFVKDILVALAIGLGSVGLAIGVFVADFYFFVEAIKNIESINGEAVKKNLADVAAGFKEFQTIFGLMDGLDSYFDAKALGVVTEAINTLIPFTEVAKEFKAADVTAIQSTMTGLAEGFKSFIDTVSSYWLTGGTGKTIKDIAEALDILSPSLNKLAKADAGAVSTNMGTIATGFQKMAEVLGENGGGYNYSTGKAQAIKILAESLNPLCEAIPKLNEIKAEDFSTKMEAIGKGYEAFSKAVEGHISIFSDGDGKAGAIGSLIETLPGLAEGVAKFMEKTKDFNKDDLKDKMGYIGDAYAAFGDALKKSTFWTDFEKGASGIVTLTDNIYLLGERGRAFVDKDSDGKLSGGLTDIGTAFKTFGEAIKDASGFLGNGDKGANNLTTVIESIDKLAPSIDSIIALSYSPGAFSTLAAGLTQIASSVRDNYGGDTARNVGTFERVMSGFSTLASKLMTLNQYLTADLIMRLQAFAATITDFAGIDLTAATDSFSQFTTSITETLNAFISNDSTSFTSVGAAIAQKMVDGMTSSEMMAKFSDAGARQFNDYIKAFNDNKEWAGKTASAISLSALNGIRTVNGVSINDKFKDVGVEAVKSFGDGILGQLEELSSTAYDKFYEAGAYAVQGFINGMDSKIGEVIEKANYIASIASETINAALVINSPSRVTFWSGEMVGEGLALGMMSKADRVEEAANHMADSVFNPINYYTQAIAQALSDNIGDDLTITPILDLTKVQEGARQLSGILAQNSLVSAESINDGFDQNGGRIGNQIVFNQYNNSPKALSQIDIYRQTRNQLSFAKGVIK